VSTLDDLLAAIGAAPCLPGARCRGRHHLFDEAQAGEHPDTVAARHAQAIALCGRCPAAERCRDWYASLPKRKRPLGGVVAGQVREPRSAGRPRRESA